MKTESDQWVGSGMENLCAAERLRVMEDWRLFGRGVFMGALLGFALVFGAVVFLLAH